VHTASVPVIIKKLRDLIKEDGLLCITTCHSTKDDGYFEKEIIKNSELLNGPIYESEFNSLINSSGNLPVHFFEFGEIEKLLADNGFKIVEFRVFHLERMPEGYENVEGIDNIVNLDPELKETNGLDMMISAMPIREDDKMIAETKYQNNFEEKLLNFKEAYLGIFYAFSMGGIKDSALDKDKVKSIINSYKITSGRLIADWDNNEDYAKDFKYAVDFHLKNLPEDRIRIKLDAPLVNNSRDRLTADMPFPNDAQPDRRLSIPIDVFLSVYPSNEIGILFFNIKFLPSSQEGNTTSTDDMIFAIHSLFEDRFNIKFHVPDYLKELGINDNEKQKMDDIIKKYEQLIYDAFDIKKECKSVKKRILEICDSGDGLNLIAAEKFLKMYPGQAYGLMVGDEGWRYVPRTFCRSRIENRWGSRDFVSIITSSNGAISLNFKNTPHHDFYKQMQEKLKNDRKETVEPYLNHNYAIAGMDHGSFLCLERAVIARLVLDQEYEKLTNSINESNRILCKFTMTRFIWRIEGSILKEIYNNFRNLNKFESELEKISSDIKHWEIENLYKKLSDEMDIDKDLDKIIGRLATHRDCLDQLYTLMTNGVVSHFNNLGIGIGFASIAIGIVLAAIGYYISGAQIYLDLPGHNCTTALGDHFLRWEGRIVNETFNGHIWNWIWNLILALMPK